MKPIPRKEYFKNECVCELTKELDKLAKLEEKHVWELFRHYMLIDSHPWNYKEPIPIRVPGGTVGGIWLDENFCITDIKIDTNYVVKTYPDDVNEKIKEKFLGTKIEIE